jgi:hypothetical protein
MIKKVNNIELLSYIEIATIQSNLLTRNLILNLELQQIKEDRELKLEKQKIRDKCKTIICLLDNIE